MFWFNVYQQITLLSCFIVTLITGILDTLMFWFYMCQQLSVLCCFIITLIAGILDTLMSWLNMSQQIILHCCFTVTMITRILDTLMFEFYMSQPLPFSVALKSHWSQGYLTPIGFDLMCVNRLRLICLEFDLINLYRCSFHQGELEERRNWNFHWEGFRAHHHLPSPAGVWGSCVMLLI